MSAEQDPMDVLKKMLMETLGEAQYRMIDESVRQHLQSDDYKQAVAERFERMEREEFVVEEADWFGRTGLPDALERELPRYLRREYGESIFDDDSLKAADLVYLGAAQDGELRIHYWRVGGASSHDEPSYAYIEIDGEGNSCTGWGDRELPQVLRTK